MAVAKRQGTEKPVKIEQRKGLRTRVRTLEQTALLANPIYTEQGKKKKHIERVAKGLGFSLSLTLSLPRSHLLLLALSRSLYPLHVYWAGIPSRLRVYFLLFSK